MVYGLKRTRFRIPVVVVYIAIYHYEFDRGALFIVIMIGSSIDTLLPVSAWFIVSNAYGSESQWL